MSRPTREAIAGMTHAIMQDLAVIRDELDGRADEARAGIETFVAIALRVFAQTNPSKLREVMRLEEIKARMDGREVIE